MKKETANDKLEKWMNFHLDDKCKYCNGEVISFLPYEENGHTFCCKECADDFKDCKVFSE